MGGTTRAGELVAKELTVAKEAARKEEEWRRAAA